VGSEMCIRDSQNPVYYLKEIKTIDELRKLPENKKCFDCGEKVRHRLTEINYLKTSSLTKY
jgi:hypothetical protein